MEALKVGQKCMTRIAGVLVEVEILAIREPNETANWTEAAPDKKVFKLRAGPHIVERRYCVRQESRLLPR